MIGIVGSRTRLRVILHTKQRLLPMGHRCNGAVVEIEVGHFDAVSREAGRIQGKTMVLTGDLNLASRAARMVETAMAIAELESGAPHGQSKNLMAEADAE